MSGGNGGDGSSGGDSGVLEAGQQNRSFSLSFVSPGIRCSPQHWSEEERDKLLTTCERESTRSKTLSLPSVCVYVCLCALLCCRLRRRVSRCLRLLTLSLAGKESIAARLEAPF